MVFPVQLDGEMQALRFYTKAHAGHRDRYRQLSEHFQQHTLTDAMAMFEWIDDGIRIGGRVLPALRMQWVRGRRLNEHVEQLVTHGDTHGLSLLAQRWRELIERLQREGFAHGDLQHGNVLVDESGALRLVDFDCSWIARFAGQRPPAETGHRNYQPIRPEARPWGPWMDSFSGLVVYTSLLALSRNPNPWAVLNSGENMLFSQPDFQPPHHTSAWQHLASIGDPEIDALAARLKVCCADGWSATGGLSDLIDEKIPWWRVVEEPGTVTDPGPQATPDHPQRPGRADAEPNWWQNIPGIDEPKTPEPEPKKPSTAGALLGALVIALVSGMLAAAAVAANGGGAKGGAAVAGLLIGLVIGLTGFLVLINRKP